MKAIFLAVSVLALAPCTARAADWTVTGSSGYVWEAQAETFSKNPVVNVESSFSLGSVPASVWVQAGDEYSQELDFTIAPEWTVGSTTATLAGSAYLYPKGKPGYAASFGTTTPVGPVALEFEAARYLGSYENTMVSLALTAQRDSGLSGSLGVAHNSSVDGFSAFARLECPLGDTGLAMGVRAYHIFQDVEERDRSGIALDLMKRF